MHAEAPSFERDIRPLFRSKDIESMSRCVRSVLL